MTSPIEDQRRFLFLQGPHGPFLAELAAMLVRTGALCWRVGFNRGDEAFWRPRRTYLAFRDGAEAWPGRIAALLAEKAITDLVLYGDTRPAHATAIAAARAAGIRVHVFEEGYLRPFWVTYERGGVNGHSRLTELTIEEMRRALAASDIDMPAAPARWGEMRQHVFYGAAYHFFLLALNRGYAGYRPHRALDVRQEFALALRRLVLMPLHALERRRATRRVRRGGFPYHLVLMQLAHDASFLAHGPFADQESFVATCLQGFAEGAPRHHHLVFKAHPLDDGRARAAGTIRRLARAAGLEGRVHFVPGGKLAALLGEARSAVTVNSTAAQQALWRGLPVRAFGRAVYAKAEFVSTQPLAEFFAAPTRPDTRAYRDFRHYLLETSQVAGGYYSARGRRQLLRQVTDMVLSAEDPYDALTSGTAAPRQQLRAVS